MKKFIFCRAGKNNNGSPRAFKKHIYLNGAKKGRARPLSHALCAAFALIIAISPLISNLVGSAGNIRLAQAASEYYSSGTFVNAAILISFEGEPQFESDFSETLEKTYNRSAVSVKSFFAAQTNGAVDMQTLLSGGGKVYKLGSPRECYMPRYGKWLAAQNEYEVINELGYDNRYYNADGVPVAPSAEGAIPCGERLLLEQRLLREALELAREDIIYELFDSFGGKLDALTLITDASGTKSEYGELLWSHKSICLNSNAFFGDGSAGGGYYAGYYFTDELKREYSNLKDEYLSLNKISAYNVICSAELTARKARYQDEELYDAGLLSHELMHSLGMGDYYSEIKNSDEYEAVGEFDVMASHCAIPQYSLSYVREKAGWLDYSSFDYINKSGTYTLYPVGSSGVSPSDGSASGSNNTSGTGSSGSASGESDYKTACKIILSDYSSRGEYFMAEVRSNESKVGAGIFDSGLSNSGLIIYRVNEKAAFTNAKGEIGIRDYCNAYDNEVYVFRKGAKALNSPLGTFSFAMLGEKNSDSSSKTTDVINDYTRFGVKKSISGDEREYVCYSDGTNSGIAFENITKNADGSVTFTVTLPESDGTFPVLNDANVKLADYYNGDKRLLWSMSAKSGNFYVLAVRATNRLKSKAERGDETIPAESIKNGVYSGYKTLFYAKIPLAEKKLTLPDFSDDALIFVAAETENGSICSRYVCAIERDDLSIKQYFIKSLDPLYVAFFGAGLLVIASCVMIIIIKNRPKRTYEKGADAKNESRKK